MKIEFITIIYIFCFWFSGIAQTEKNYMVYSFTGDVKIKEKGLTKSLKPFDYLSSGEILVFKPASKLTYISLKDKGYHEAAKPGTFTVAQIVMAEKKEAGTMSKAFGYIAENFIEKGKMIHERMSYKEAGVVERSLDNNPLIFPFDNTLVYQTRRFVPVFNTSLAKLNPEFIVTIRQGNEILQTISLKEGDTLYLDKKLNRNEDIIMVVKWKQQSNEVRLFLVDEEQRAFLDKELREINKTVTTMPMETQLFTRALFFEDNKCYIDALSCYDKLEKIRGKDEKYIFLKKQFLKNERTGNNAN